MLHFLSHKQRPFGESSTDSVRLQITVVKAITMMAMMQDKKAEGVLKKRKENCATS
jgi:hypothetical protein